MTSLSSLITPACVIDVNRLKYNSARMLAKAEAAGVPLRPHVKTLKSAQAAAIYAPLPSPITVSSLAEARYFANVGYHDILYAVGLTPNKYPAVNALLENGVALVVTVDNLAAVNTLCESAAMFCQPLKVVIELDVDGHRAGIAPGSDSLLSMAKQIRQAGQLIFAGVMAHAGASYGCNNKAAQTAMAKQECERTLLAASRLADAGLHCSIISVGSTPTALSDYHPQGITEIRAGVYATFDLVMADLNVCAVNDIALSVLTSVIGHQQEKNWVLVDAGWMGLSRDKGSGQHGYGLVADINGNLLDGWYVSMTNQEHGIIQHKDGLPIPNEIFNFGSQLRVLPNHACATAGQYRKYYVTHDNETICDVWESADGW